MWALAAFVLQLVLIAAGIRNEQRAGMWSWSKFAFALGFAALECTILIVPVTVMNVNSRYFVPVYVTCGVVAALNVVWMIVLARRWKLPDGRTSLQAYRDEQAAVKNNGVRSPQQP
jgi:hypothetical protein